MKITGTMRGVGDFVGRWQVRRNIDDRYGSQKGAFQGICTFQENGLNRLDYREEGTIRFATGPELTANRQYQWHFGSRLVDVRFEDGSAFHSFVPMGQVSGTEHPCGEDHYTVEYDFLSWPDWQATWRVTGPRKDYTTTSLYTR